MQPTRRSPEWMPTVRTWKRFGQESFLPETGPQRDGPPPWKARSGAVTSPRNLWREPQGYETPRFLCQIFPRPDSCAFSDSYVVKLWGLSLNHCPLRKAPRSVVPANQIERAYGYNFHFVRVYAMQNPLRSALRWESLPGAATIIARSHP